MLTTTHSLIGKTITEVFSHHLGIGLEEGSFKYGCIKPDIVPRLRLVPHYIGSSLDFVLDSVETIQNRMIIPTQPEIKKFSIELGVVIHYIADYFCYAHNQKRYDFIPLHMVYENKLAQAFSKTDLRGIGSCSLYAAVDWKIMDRNGWKSYITSKHKEYLRCREGIFEDIWFTMEVCTLVSYLITMHSLGSRIKTAA